MFDYTTCRGGSGSASLRLPRSGESRLFMEDYLDFRHRRAPQRRLGPRVGVARRPSALPQAVWIDLSDRYRAAGGPRSRPLARRDPAPQRSRQSVRRDRTVGRGAADAAGSRLRAQSFVPVLLRPIGGYDQRTINPLVEEESGKPLPMLWIGNSWGGTRTPNRRIMTPLLYRLSYPAGWPARNRSKATEKVKRHRRALSISAPDKCQARIEMSPFLHG